MATVDFDAIVVGAGFGGIRSLWELRKLGLSAKSFEAGSDVGGAWYWNRYPGARTDSEAWVYNLNFAQELRDEWDFKERYPSQGEVQTYLSKVVGQSFRTGNLRIIPLTLSRQDRFDLRKQIQFNSRIKSAHFMKSDKTWKITTTDGSSATCRYFIAATGPLSVEKDAPFPGLKSFKGEWYMAAKWPKGKINFAGKRIALIGTGATGVQIVPKIAPVAKSLTVFQRTPNYVLPGRNYTIDEHQVHDIKTHYDDTWDRAGKHPFGLDMTPSGKKLNDLQDPDDIKQLLDQGWEAGGFHFQFETFEDVSIAQEANDVASEYLRNKIRAVVRDPETAKTLTPKYPFGAKRPPCGHFYYEAYNRPNVKLVDISEDDFHITENGIRTQSGQEFEFDMIICAIGFDAATGALSEMDVRGKENKSLKDYWNTKLQTFAGMLVPGFPNMFMVVGPHVPFGNMPVVIELSVSWIGNAIEYMEKNNFNEMAVSDSAVEFWTQHVNDVFKVSLTAEASKATHSWFMGTNIPGKACSVLFYFGGIPTWRTWLDKEAEDGWKSMEFSSASGNDSGFLRDNRVEVAVSA